ncbi:polyketide beta-ketoacyl-synthase [Phlegmacium glaucopus]|nr:polyketide beta-ketoacyl-synthase [Phlegmacium glaucopus]
MSITPLLLLVFGGQGSLPFQTPQTDKQTLRLAESSSGRILLAACYSALHAELNMLSDDELEELDLYPSDFLDKQNLIIPPDVRYITHPAICGPTLLLIQILRYLLFIDVETAPSSTRPFVDIFQSNIQHGVGVLGFSSGILSACVVGTSCSTLVLINRAVEAYRLALWIGIRAQMFRVGALKLAPPDIGSTSWGLVLFGISKCDTQNAISLFNKHSKTGSLFITAVLDDKCVTVSGRPDHLFSFKSTLPKDVFVRDTTLQTLYHSPVHFTGTRTQIINDISSRNILFPTFADIIVPIRSTLSGDPITKATTTGGSLAELVVDMVLTQPVNWDLVVSKATMSIPCQIPVHIVNVGPGTSLTRGIERTFTLQGIAIDKRSDLSNHPYEAKQEPIAIVGMAVNMPGAPNVDRLWEILANGSNTVEEIPKYRFDSALYTNGENPGRTMKAHMGNFIEGVDEFDHQFFNVSPREAKSMDPQQRILLQVAYEALEDSGYVPNSTRSFDTETFGCFVGAATHDYVQNLRSDIDVYYGTGTLDSFLSGRLSYCLGLSGPSLVVDTACSSSIVALHQASRALMNRDCDAALVGAVNIISSPDMFIGLDRGHFLSPSGQCKPFDASADGYCRGEGCGVFVLKRLSDAIDENDRILGVIRGIEVNQSGKAQSITHPHVPSQAALFGKLLSNSGVDANSVNVVEAHGTGTQAGDQSEMASIRQVLAVGRSPSNPLYVTSIKANIGHLEAASGCASLAKVLLMFHRQVIPQQISLQTLNPGIAPLTVDNTIVTTINVPWYQVKEGKPRIALVNNFGASGSNAAVLVEEHISAQSPLPPLDGISYVFGLSAKNGPSLEALRSKYLIWLQDFPDQRLLDVAYTMTARRQVYPCRLAVTAGNSVELANGLASAPLVRVSKDPSRVVFVFTGQGMHYHGMGRSLYLTSPIFKRHIDECHKILVLSGFAGIVPLITAKMDDDSGENDARSYQCAVFSIEFALAKLWMFWGIRPVAIVGHSLGEFAGLVVAGVLNLRDALIFIATRERLMLEKCEVESSGMVAVSLEPVKLQTLLDSQQAFSHLSIACYNSPSDCVVSGPLPQLKVFGTHPDIKTVKNSQLAVPHGYHSLAMLPVLDDLRVLSGKTKTQAPSLPVISTVLGRVVMPGDLSSFTNDYLVRHCVEPVRFTQGISSYVSNVKLLGGTIWIELGPHPGILPMLQKFPDLSDSMFLGSLRKRQDSWSAMSATLCSLYLTDQPLDWRRVFSQVGSTSCTSLPSYPFSKDRFWIPFREETASSIAGIQSNDSMIHNWVQLPSMENGNIAVFEIPITRIERYMTGHCVAGLPLCPASVFLEFVVAGVILTTKHLAKYYDDLHVALQQIHFTKALTSPVIKQGDTMIRVVIEADSGTFTIGSGLSKSEYQIIHAHGEYRLQSASEMATKLACNVTSIPQVLKMEKDCRSESFSARTVYEVIFPRVVKYSKEFHTVQRLVINSDGMGVSATIALGSVCDRASFVIDPIFLDTLLHVAGFVSNLRGDLQDAYICDEIGLVEFIPAVIKSGATFVIHCDIFESSEKNAMLAESYAISDAHPRAIVAHMKGIRFRRVRLSHLKAGLANSPAMTSSSFEPTSPASNRDIQSSKQRVFQIIARTCDIDAADITLASDLDRFGIDSLMRIELSLELVRAFPTIGDIQKKILQCNTIADIVQIVSSADNVIDDDPFSTRASATSSSPTFLLDDWEIAGGTSLLRRILADILDIDQNVITDDQDLTYLGLDSLTSMEAIYRIKKECNLHLSASFFECNRTLHDIHTSIYEQHTSTPPPINDKFNTQLVVGSSPVRGRLADISNLDQKMVPLQQSPGNKMPLVLIHDGSGLTISYRGITDLNRDTWGISNPRFASLRPWESVVEMAELYAEYILEKLEGGPVILGGWSFGGVVAFEVAKQLGIKSKLVKVKGVILIDTPDPLNHVPLSLPLIEDIIGNSNNGNLKPDVRELCKTQFTTNAKLLSEYDPYAYGTVGDLPLEALPVRLVCLVCSDGYKAPSSIDVPSWLADRGDRTTITEGWELVSGSAVQVLDIPGHHFEPFQPQNIATVSTRIAEACEVLEKE